jgi:hypothetical protein
MFQGQSKSRECVLLMIVVDRFEKLDVASCHV